MGDQGRRDDFVVLAAHFDLGVLLAVRRAEMSCRDAPAYGGENPPVLGSEIA